MNIPGFAAEASLYKTSLRYMGRYYVRHQSNGNTVVSTQARRGDKVQMAAPAIRRRARAGVCPPAIMDGSSMWCLYDSDAESCTYEECGYV
jgi:hypothetical protein